MKRHTLKVFAAAFSFLFMINGICYSEVQNSIVIKAQETDEYVQEVLCLVNEQRKLNGVPLLQTAPIMNQLAHIRAEELVEIFSHMRPDGTKGMYIGKDYGISYMACGENIAAGYYDPESVMNGWITSEGHMKNMMNPNFNYIGVGVVYDPSSAYGYYWTQLFYNSVNELEDTYTAEKKAESETVPEQNNMLGDVNEDNEVDIRDVVLLNQHIVNMNILNSQAFINADVVSDNVIDVKDLGQLKKYILKIIDSF